MATAKKTKTKSKSVAKSTTSRPKGGAAAVAVKRRPSEAALFVAGVCITFLLLVDTYYIYQLAQIHN